VRGPQTPKILTDAQFTPKEIHHHNHTLASQSLHNAPLSSHHVMKSKPSRNRVNLYLDIALFVAFLITTAPHFSGIAIHEWLSIALIAAFVIHLLLHWSWIVNTTKRLFGRTTARNRVNYVLNAALFVDMVVIMFSGIMISESALPALGIPIAPGFAWRRLHDSSANIGLLIFALHVALHWQWIATMFATYVLRRPATPMGTAKVMANTEARG
jgi:hypothetical protein